ncbi:BamA/TamA family outer membrane protein [bacterium]|nr:BamA/TamA family outer membrane protein [bacterium]
MHVSKWQLFVLLTIHAAIIAQPAGADSSRAHTEYGVYPVLYYSPETRWAYGAAMTILRRSNPDERPSTWIPMLVYTQNKQIIARINADLYQRDETWHTDLWFGYYDFPDQFYGIGNQVKKEDKEKYRAKRLVLQLGPKFRFRPGLYIGAKYEFMYQRLNELEPEGLLVLGQIPGSKKGTASGLGACMHCDNRDDVYFPSKGHYHQCFLFWFGSALGSDYEFRRMTLDLRQYFPIRPGQCLAVQFYSQMITGTAPFQLLSKLGGSKVMRGYYEGRYRDNHAMAFQSEYRFFFTDRLGAVLFGSFGDVSDRLAHFRLKTVKLTYGFGLRFAFIPGETMNLRMDFGYGKDTSGLYMEVSEAF